MQRHARGSPTPAGADQDLDGYASGTGHHRHSPPPRAVARRQESVWAGERVEARLRVPGLPDRHPPFDEVSPEPGDDPPGRELHSEGISISIAADSGGWVALWAAIYFVLIVTLGVMSIRKGHWVMLIVGIFLPFFWVIVAWMPGRLG